METEAIDKLFLELSQVTTAMTARERALAALLRHAYPQVTAKSAAGREVRRAIAHALVPVYGAEWWVAGPVRKPE